IAAITLNRVSSLSNRTLGVCCAQAAGAPAIAMATATSAARNEVAIGSSALRREPRVNRPENNSRRASCKLTLRWEVLLVYWPSLQRANGGGESVYVSRLC